MAKSRSEILGPIGYKLARFIEKTKHIPRAISIGSGKYAYPEIQSCLDFSVFRTLLTRIDDEILAEHENLFPFNNVVMDSSSDITFADVMEIFKYSEDKPMKEGNETAQMIRDKYDVPVTKPENFCTLLRHKDKWISGHVAVFRTELYVFLARILYLEFDVALPHILHPLENIANRLVTTTYPPVLTILER